MVAESYRLLKPNGLLIIDQVLSGGKVADSTQRDPESISRRDVIKVIKEDERWLVTVIPIGAGPSNTPWWLPSDEVKQVRVVQTKSNSNFIVIAVVIALIAGAIGAMVGRSSSTNIGANLVDTKNIVERAPDSIAALAARVIPAVVSISINSSSGSGFFFDSDGFILTNNHVVKSSTLGKITVELSNGKKYPAKLIGRDASYDLAVLKIDVTSAPTLQLGNSDSILVGDTVIAIGSPLGLSGTVTSGIISAKNRAVTTGDRTGESSFINALQTDAAINPGNSGGPLIDIAGAVVGVNSAIATLGYGNSPGSIGLGFAIPINQAKKTVDQLIKTGSATYPIMGITVDTSFTGNGALISNQGAGITAGGPAAKAGLKAGDVITKLDGKSIDNSDELIVVIRSKNIGDKVKVEYSRNNVTREVVVTLAGSK
jgi:putative serine protease PepD